MNITKTGNLPSFEGGCVFCGACVEVHPGDKEYDVVNKSTLDPTISVRCPTEGCRCTIYCHIMGFYDKKAK